MPAAPAQADPPIDAAVQALADRGVARSYRRGTLLIQEGDVGDTIYVILSGRLRVFGSNAGNDREITYGTYGAGEYVGEMGFDGAPRAASVVAVEPTQCAVVTRTTLLAHLAEHPEFALELLKKVIRRARAATMTAKQMALNDVYGRLKLWLDVNSAALADGSRVVRAVPTQVELARQLGCTREMINRVLKDLVKGGYVRPQPDGSLLLPGTLPVRW